MVTFEYLPEFERHAKALAKKYRSFVYDYNTFLDELDYLKQYQYEQR